MTNDPYNRLPDSTNRWITWLNVIYFGNIDQPTLNPHLFGWYKKETNPKAQVFMDTVVLS